MSDMRELLSLIDEEIQVEDSFDLELSEDLLIETGIVGLTEDGIIVEADDEMLGLLEAMGIELEEGDIIKGPWGDKPPAGVEVPVEKPKAPVVPMNKPQVAPPKFRIQDLYKEFINAPQVKQKLNAIMRGNLPPDIKDDELMNLALQYLEAKLGKVHPKLLGRYAIAFLDMNKASTSAQEMKEDDLEEIVNLAGINMVGGKTPQELERMADVPTAQRYASGETKPVDRTDYNTPPALRNPTVGMTGPEKRRASLIKQGILKATKEELDVEECGYDLNPRVMAEGPGDEPVEPDMDSDDKRWDDAENPMAGEVKEEKINEAYINSTQDVVELLATLREIGKGIENGRPYDGNFANLCANYLGYVWNWLEPRVDENDSKLQPILNDVFAVWKRAGQLQRSPGSGSNRSLANEIINFLYPLIQWVEMNSSKIQSVKVREDEVDEAKYQGREVPLGKPMAGDVKKSKVYVRKPNGKVVKVNFGDKNMRIKKSNPGRRKNFRARHNCKNPGPRWKARYWSCRAW